MCNINGFEDIVTGISSLNLTYCKINNFFVFVAYCIFIYCKNSLAIFNLAYI